MTTSDYQDDQDVMLADARQEDFGSRMAGAVAPVMPANHLMTPRQVGDLFGTLMTAQPVVKARDHKHLMIRLKALAASFGDTYEYSWRVKDKNSKAPDGKTEVSGPTIKLAMDLCREYGNCAVDIREIEGPTHWTFYARFVDLETGYSLTRAFRQRKNALQGKYEDDRKLDMAYQMGQSKASRNVVVNALSNYVDHMRTEAARSSVGAITQDPKKYLEGIQRGLEKFAIDISRAEGMVGRIQKEWSPRDIAQVMNGLKAINDGMADARDVFPDDAEVPHDQDGVVQDKKTQEPGEPTDPGNTDSGEGAAAASSEAKPAGAAKKVEAPSAPAGEAAKPKASKPKAPPPPEPEPEDEREGEPEESEPAPAAEPARKPAAKKPAGLF